MVVIVMTSWYGKVFRITSLLWGESNGHRMIPSQSFDNAKFDLFIATHNAGKKRHKKHSNCWWSETHCRSSGVTINWQA